MPETSNRMCLPVVVLRDTALFPTIDQQLEIVRQKSVNAVRSAIDGGQRIFVTMQHDASVEEPGAGDVHETGVIANVMQILPAPNPSTMLIKLRCVERGRAEIYSQNNMLRALVEVCPQQPGEGGLRSRALLNALRGAMLEYNRFNSKKRLIASVVEAFFERESFEKCVYAAANGSQLKGRQKQELLETESIELLCERLISALKTEAEILKLQKDIEAEVKQNIDENQKEYYLREQLRVIGEKLGDDSPAGEAEKYREKVMALELPEDSKQQLLGVCDKLAKLPSGSHEAAAEYTYLDACIALPWGKFSEEKSDVAAAEAILDRDHFGLEKVKERMLEFIAVRSLAPDIKGQIICLVGPPGVGKTSIAHSVAEALGRKYQRVSLGGVHDEADIRGHRKTYIGAMPGRIAHALRLSGVMNPLMLLDEVDKLANDIHGDPTSALLEVLDPEQNVAFHDHYIDIPIDLSHVVFITTANDASRIPAPLLDRMEVIELPSYTLEEKCSIAKLHLVKKQTARHGLNGNRLRITGKAVTALIEGYTREAGVRNLEREIASLCRKAAKKVALGCDSRITITDKNLEEYLGPAKYSRDKAVKKPEVGVVNGLAWTSVGGTLLETEAAVMDGSGKLELTGSLGDVMKESAQAAVSFIRTKAKEWGIDPDFHKTKDIHIHFPEGGIPKDGPSAGVTITTAIVSALTGIPVRAGVAMTGEISLRGRVLRIGGLREKSMAAFAAGIKTIIIPEDNLPDVSQLSEAVREAINFVPVSAAEKVLETALERMPRAE